MTDSVNEPSAEGAPSGPQAANLGQPATTIRERPAGPCEVPCDVEEGPLCTGCAVVYELPEPE